MSTHLVVVCETGSPSLHFLQPLPTTQQSLSFSSRVRSRLILVLLYFALHGSSTTDNVLPILTTRLTELTMSRLGNGVRQSIALHFLRPEPKERVGA